MIPDDQSPAMSFKLLSALTSGMYQGESRGTSTDWRTGRGFEVHVTSTETPSPFPGVDVLLMGYPQYIEQ